MLKMLLITTAVTALIGSSAMAQVETPTGAAQQKSPAASSEQQKSPAASGNKFIMEQHPDQWVFSKFKGTDVMGPDNASVGAVNDLLFDRTGKIVGMVVGVGGFLGIGAKNVAIDMGAFDVVPVDSSSASPSASVLTDATSVKLKVAWTKDQLKDAPDFRYYQAPASAAAPATTGAAPGAPASPLPGPDRPR
jgi:Ca2+-binding RTX toxin-like protein